MCTGHVPNLACAIEGWLAGWDTLPTFLPATHGLLVDPRQVMGPQVLPASETEVR